MESEPRTPQPGRPVRQSPPPLVLDELRPRSRLDGCAQNTVGQPPALGGIWGEAPRVPCRKAGSWDATPRCPQIAPFSLRASFLFFFLSPSHLLTPPPCTRAPTHTHQAKVKDVCSGGAVPRTSCSEVRDKLEGPQSGSAPLSPARSEIGTKDSQLGFAPHTLQPCKTETALGVPS